MASRPTLCILLLLAMSACRESPHPVLGEKWVLEVHDGTGNGGPLSLAALTSLTIETSYRGTPGRHPLRIDVLGPGRNLYAQLRGTLVASPQGSGSATQVLEVDGTPIEAFHMTGKWQFVLSTDDAGGLASASLDVVD